MRTALRLDEGALECFSVPFLLVRPFSKKKKKSSPLFLRDIPRLSPLLFG
jgi:hypothetical protein